MSTLNSETRDKDVLAREETHALPPWVAWLSSESLLFFAVPIAAWAALCLVFNITAADAKSFRLACSLTWSAFALITCATLLSNLIFQSIANDLFENGISLREPFSFFYTLSNSLTGFRRLVVILLGAGKVLALCIGGLALWGGLLVIAIWLPTLNDSRVLR